MVFIKKKKKSKSSQVFFPSVSSTEAVLISRLLSILALHLRHHLHPKEGWLSTETSTCRDMLLGLLFIPIFYITRLKDSCSYHPSTLSIVSAEAVCFVIRCSSNFRHLFKMVPVLLYRSSVDTSICFYIFAMGMKNSQANCSNTFFGQFHE